MTLMINKIECAAGNIVLKYGSKESGITGQAVNEYLITMN